jgi:hypothetical protein
MWMTEWRAISARIAALLDAGKFLLSARLSDRIGSAEIIEESRSRDTAPARYVLGAVRVLGNNAKRTGDTIQRFFISQASQLPDGPRECLQKFVEEQRWEFGDPPHLAGMTAVIAAFASFRAEFEYLISDIEVVAKTLVVRALTHLNSSIAADGIVRQRWQVAFEAGEPACELLGACHFLYHGIWSFKASTKGARTDLVLGDDTAWEEANRASQGLVLTEWKKVRNNNELDRKANEAYEQAKIYCGVPLAGFEVASTRYLILVSETRMKMPPAKIVAGVTYEYRNVAVRPETPSIEARNGAS